MYKENPKTKDSGIICAIPQAGECPYECPDCFFQSGRSYLEPLKDNLPNMPTKEQTEGRVVRVNDGNDSTIGYLTWNRYVKKYPDRFYNTSNDPHSIAYFDAPVVLTINPSEMTDTDFHKVDHIPNNLMFVRIRANTWNLQSVVRPAIIYYRTKQIVPVVLTFMAYHSQDRIPQSCREDYIERKRTLNSYFAITTAAWHKIMDEFKYMLVYSCGKVEGELGNPLCKHCGNCLREYYATKERMRK